MQKPTFVKKPKDDGKDKDGNPETSEFKEIQSQYEKEQAAVARAEQERQARAAAKKKANENKE